MNSKIKELVAALEALPEAKQPEWVDRFLEELNEAIWDEKWEQTLNSEASVAFIKKMIDEVEAEEAAGIDLPLFDGLDERRKKLETGAK